MFSWLANLPPERLAIALMLWGAAVLCAIAAFARGLREPADPDDVGLSGLGLVRSDEQDATEADLIGGLRAITAQPDWDDEPTVEIPIDPVLAAVHRRWGLTVLRDVPPLLRPWPGMHEPITSMFEEAS